MTRDLSGGVGQGCVLGDCLACKVLGASLGRSALDQCESAKRVTVSWLPFSLVGLFHGKAHVAAPAQPWALSEMLSGVTGVITVGPFISIKVAGAFEPALAWRFP